MCRTGGPSHRLERHQPCPQDWVRNEHNNHHGGFRFSIVEYYELCDESAARWSEYKDAQDPPIRVNNCPTKGPLRYDELYEEYTLKNFKQLGESWPVICMARTSFSELKHLPGAWDLWKQHIEDNSNLRHPFFSSPECNAIMIKHNKKVYDSIVGGSELYSHFAVKELLVQALLFTGTQGTARRSRNHERSHDLSDREHHWSEAIETRN